MVNHFPVPPRLAVTFGGRTHELHYMTRADVSALVQSIDSLCGALIHDREKITEAFLSDRKVLDPLLMRAFPDSDSISCEDLETKAGLLSVVWEANDISAILEDMDSDVEMGRESEGEPDPLIWPKFCLHMRRIYGIDEDTMFNRWTYWQFTGFSEAASELVADPEEKKETGKTVEELMEAGIIK